MNKKLGIAAFLLGLAAVVWVAAGYANGHPLALTMTLLMAAVYIAGGLELHRFNQATTGLDQALRALPADAQPAAAQSPTDTPTDTPAHALTDLPAWLAQLPLALRNAVRQRIAGERAGLPGPTMTPYLVGLLVLLGMLGTFLGMVVTLQGATSALESTTDVAALRAALSAPVKGLGLAFGTSVAGVAASSMLGLVSALCRRQRLQVAQALDSRMAGALRVHTPAHQREQAARLQQHQLDLQQQLLGLQQQQLAQLQQNRELQELTLQTQRHSIDLRQQTLQKLDLAQAQRQEGLQLHHSQLQQQLQHEQERVKNRELQQAQQARLQEHHDQLVQTLQQQGRTLPEAAAQMRALVDQMAQQSQQNHTHLVASQDTFHSRYQASTQATFSALAASVDQSLKHSLTQSALAAGAAIAPAVATTMAGIRQETAAFQQRLADSVQAQLAGVASHLDAAMQNVSATWARTAAQQDQSAHQQWAELKTALTGWSAQFGKQSADLLQTVQHSHAALHTHASSSEQQRLATWTQTITAMASGLHQSWQAAGTQARAHNAEILQTLETTARQMQAQAETHARSTINEVTRLLNTAAEAPRVAAEVVGQLRLQLSDSLARDNTLLDERARIMATLGGLLDTVNRAATEQHSAIDTLVASSATVLQQASAQLGQQLEAGTTRLATAAVQVSGGALEVASMGEAFASAVQLFGQSSAALAAQLQRIELALDKSSSRSDDQLAYYVAQAREIIELSVSSQKQVVDELQRVTRRPQHAAVPAAAPSAADEAA